MGKNDLDEEEDDNLIKKMIIFGIIIIFLMAAAFVSYKLVRRIVRQHRLANAPSVNELEEEEPEVEEVERIVKIESIEGNVSIFSPSLNEAVNVSTGIELISEDEITVTDGSITIISEDDKHIKAGPDTKFKVIFSGSDLKGRIIIEVEYGNVLVTLDNQLNPGSLVDVNTPNALCSLRGSEGTTFELTYNKDKDITDTKVIKGKVEVTDKTDGMAYIVAESMDFAIPYTEYGYFDDNIAPVFYVNYPQYAIFVKGSEDNTYPYAKFDPTYGVTAVDEADGECSENITYEILDAEDGRKECRYSVFDKAGNVDSFSIFYSENSFLETEGDLYTANDVLIHYAMNETDD